MEQSESSRLFKVGSIFAVLALTSIVIFSVALSLPHAKKEINARQLKEATAPNTDMSAEERGDVWYKITPTIAISFLSLVVSSTGTAFTIFLGWRADRRQTKESNMKIEELEIQLAEARGRRPDREGISN